MMHTADFLSIFASLATLEGSRRGVSQGFVCERIREMTMMAQQSLLPPPLYLSCRAVCLMKVWSRIIRLEKAKQRVRALPRQLHYRRRGKHNMVALFVQRIFQLQFSLSILETW